MPAASTAGLSTAARPICSRFHPVATLAQRGKPTQRRQAQAVSWVVKTSAAQPSHRVAAPLSNQARSMPAASTAGLSTAAMPICSRFHPVATLAQRGKPTQRESAASGLTVTSNSNFNETSIVQLSAVAHGSVGSLRASLQCH